MICDWFKNSTSPGLEPIALGDEVYEGPTSQPLNNGTLSGYWLGPQGFSIRSQFVRILRFGYFLILTILCPDWLPAARPKIWFFCPDLDHTFLLLPGVLFRSLEKYLHLLIHSNFILYWYMCDWSKDGVYNLWKKSFKTVSFWSLQAGVASEWTQKCLGNGVV